MNKLSSFKNTQRKNKHSFKKLICTSLLVFGLLGSGSAHALPTADWLNTAAQYGSLAKQYIMTASTEIVKLKTTMLEEVQRYSWVKQLKEMASSISEAKKAADDAMSVASGLMDTGSIVTEVMTEVKLDASGNDTADHSKDSNLSYAPKSPNKYSAKNPYKGDASKESAKDIYDSFQVDGNKGEGIETFFLPKSDADRFKEAAKVYSYQVANTQAMLEEAYAQTSNRIAKIDELKKLIVSSQAQIDAAKKTGKDPKALGGKEASSKRILDLQASIQAEQTAMTNEQIHISTLVGLQTSQKTGFDLRKNAIVEHALYRKSTDIELAQRSAILALSNVGFKALANSWKSIKEEGEGAFGKPYVVAMDASAIKAKIKYDDDLAIEELKNKTSINTAKIDAQTRINGNTAFSKLVNETYLPTENSARNASACDRFVEVNGVPVHTDSKGNFIISDNRGGSITCVASLLTDTRSREVRNAPTEEGIKAVAINAVTNDRNDFNKYKDIKPNDPRLDATKPEYNAAFASGYSNVYGGALQAFNNQSQQMDAHVGNIRTNSEVVAQSKEVEAQNVIAGGVEKGVNPLAEAISKRPITVDVAVTANVQTTAVATANGTIDYKGSNGSTPLVDTSNLPPAPYDACMFGPRPANCK